MEILQQFTSPNFWPTNFGYQLIVLHGTGGSLDQSIAWLCDPASEVSASYIIGRNGKVYCLVSPYLGRSAWANGPVKMPNLNNPVIADIVRRGINPNRVSISIEHEAASSSMFSGLPMPDVQMQASQDLVRQLCQDFKIPMNRTRIIGHRELNLVDRPYCPGVINLDDYVKKLSEANMEMSINGYTVRGEILGYWQALPDPVFTLGYPLTEEYVDPADNRTTQVFERQVLKFYPENQGKWRVQGLLLGRDFLVSHPIY